MSSLRLKCQVLRQIIGGQAESVGHAHNLLVRHALGLLCSIRPADQKACWRAYEPTASFWFVQGRRKADDLH